MTNITINVADQDHHPKYRYRFIPKIGPVTTQKGPVPPSYNHHHWHEGEMMFQFVLNDEQNFTISIGTVVDGKGNAVPTPPGSLTWAVDNPNMLAITPAADGLSCLISAVGPLGVGNVTVTLADSSGNKLASGQAQVTITPSAPVTINLTGSAPVNQ